MRSATKAVHLGQEPGPNAPLAPHIHVASTCDWKSFDEEPEFVYSRYGHANRKMLEATVASLEGANYAVGFGSGMAAMNAALSLAKVGDHVVIADDLYGGTSQSAEWLLPRQGVEVGHFDSTRPESLDAALRPETKLVVFETPTNPTLKIADIRAIVNVARKRSIKTVVDNTFATPYFQNPLSLGADIVMHSTTKFLNGHSDVVGGILAMNDPEIQEHAYQMAKLGGGVPGPFDCWLTLRGIRTLIPRMRMHESNAQTLAAFLEGHSKIEVVHYPGLASHPGHAIAKSQMSGFGAMLAIEVMGGETNTLLLAERLRLFKRAGSLGGVESSLSYPPKLSHAAMSEQERLRRGIPSNLLRVSVGLEDPQDLLEDLEQALGTLD